MSDRRSPGRREFLALGLGAFAVAALPASLVGKRRLVRRTVPVMGTVAEVGVVHRDEVWAQRAIGRALDELRRVEALMTRFREDSDVGRANARAARTPVAVSQETAEVVGEALAWARASDGRFDPCLGRAVRLWDVAARTSPPPGAAVGALAGRELWRAAEVETTGSVPRIRFHDADVALDLGGIAKGYGVDAAARVLREHGVFSALVNVGGDLVAMGASEDDDPWRIGVRDPEDLRRLVATLPVSDAAVATSGDYLQFFRWGGRRYHHLLDPRSGEPRRTPMRSLTVTAERCLTADAAATTAFGLSSAEGGAVLAHASDARIAHTV